GKNNSGKTNILAAIASFFRSLSAGNLIALDAAVWRQIDFHGKDTSRPIEIAVTFVLELAERDALIRDIVGEAPQMKNAIDGLDPGLRLVITLSINPPPRRFSYVSRVALGGTTRPGSKRVDPEHLLLQVTDEAANELYSGFAVAATKSRDADGIRAA